MRVIGVIDLMSGRAVHAQRGHRDAYAPVSMVAGMAVDGDPAALAHAYVERLGIRDIYVADLDAILGGAIQEQAIRAIGTAGAPLWVDAGIASPERARLVRRLAPDVRAIVGLETLKAFDTLEAIGRDGGGDRTAFSLDLRAGMPMIASDAIAPQPPDDIAVRAVAAGVGHIIVLDLDRVGARGGLDVKVIATVRRAAADVQLLAGGGVRGFDDLAELNRCGCDGALVATALHDGRLSRADVLRAAGWTRQASTSR